MVLREPAVGSEARFAAYSFTARSMLRGGSHVGKKGRFFGDGSPRVVGRSGRPGSRDGEGPRSPAAVSQDRHTGLPRAEYPAFLSTLDMAGRERRPTYSLLVRAAKPRDARDQGTLPTSPGLAAPDGSNLFVSDDIGKGSRWFDAVETQLAKADVGVVCITREGLRSGWIHFEAGALARTIRKKRRRGGALFTYLLGVRPDELTAPAEYQGQGSSVMTPGSSRPIGTDGDEDGRTPIGKRHSTRTGELRDGVKAIGPAGLDLFRPRYSFGARHSTSLSKSARGRPGSIDSPARARRSRRWNPIVLS